MKAGKIGFYEIENRIREVIIELERRPMDEKLVLEKAGELSFLLSLCIGQMKAVDAAQYPEKKKHLSILQSASEAITYKINTCTVEDAKAQLSKAYKAFGVQ
jgi:hypothetical protein